MMRPTFIRTRGFTLMELLLAVAIIALVSTIVMVAQRISQEKRNDMNRASDIGNIQKGLALYMASASSYPVMNGCITGEDLVTAALRSKGIINANVEIVDPAYPEDPTSCYYYTSNGSTYSLRYTLQAKSTVGVPGNVTVTP